MNFIKRIQLYRHSLETIPSIEPNIPCDVTALTEPDLPRLHEVWPVPLNEMKARLQRGDLCFVASVGDRLAHYSWTQFAGQHEIRDVGQEFTIAPNEAWIYHCRTAAWARGRGIYPFVLVRIEKLCATRGCSSVWIYTDTENTASQRGILKAGFSLYKQLTALCLFGRNFPMERV
jgi:hypothetical protein